MSASQSTPAAEPRDGDGGDQEGVWRRRFISLSLLFGVTVLLLVGAPLWLGLALGVDLLNRARGRPLRFAAARFVLFLGLVALCECWGVLVALLLWLRRGSLDAEAWREAHYRLQRRWADALLGGALGLYGMKVEVEGDEVLDGRPMLLLMRHVSVGDGLLAVRYVNSAHGYRLRFVVKRELLWDPCLDIVGGRIPNAYVRRDGADSAREVARVRALGDALRAQEGVIVFPEGTRFSPARRERALQRLAEEGRTPLLERARHLKRSLPPRPGGVLGLLAQNPNLDVVVCGHVGLEEGTRLTSFLRGELIGETLRLRFWRFSASDLPLDAEARLAWLYERWAEMDAWADAHLRAEPQATG